MMDAQKLRSIFQGQVTLPGDSNYDEVRQVFYGGIDKKPAVIIRVINKEDVQKAIKLAKEKGLELAIRSGGHSVAGYSTTDGGIVIDLRDMKMIDIDTSKKTVWAETGLTAGELTGELDKHDMVLGFGDTGSVGIGGITLGGGVGFLARKFGLAIDNLLAAEIVTANGDVLRVDADNHADLFWALKGGGGNFGVVTKFQYRLHELGSCYGGMLLLPATAEVITDLVKLAQKAPEELSVIANVMPAFPLPFVPEKYHGKLSVMALMVYAGDPKEGEKATTPFKALAKPIADLLKPMRYKDIFFPEDNSYHPTAVSKNMHLNKVSLKLAEDAIQWLDKIDAPIKALQLRVLGGAMSRVPEGETAYAHRQNVIMANIAAFYEAEKDRPTKQKWVKDFSAALYQGDNAAYVGFLGPSEQGRLNAAYPDATLKRLKEVKSKYDPENFFKRNFNILPN